MNIIPSNYRFHNDDLVQAVQLTNHNIEAAAEWCGGLVREEIEDIEKPIIRVWLALEDDGDYMEAELGDWVVKDLYGFAVVSDVYFSRFYEKEGFTP